MKTSRRIAWALLFGGLAAGLNIFMNTTYTDAQKTPFYMVTGAAVFIGILILLVEPIKDGVPNKTIDNTTKTSPTVDEIHTLLKENNLELTATGTKPKNIKTSVADELIKLKNLLDTGALTQSEFDEQKRKLLQ